MSITVSESIHDPIRLYIDDESFLYDVYGLITAFYPGKKPEILKDPEGADITIRVPMEKAKLEPAAAVEKSADRLAIKNTLKAELYRALSERQGRTLPWGTLTGVRPTKLTLRELSRGSTFDDTVDYMKNTYLASEEKAQLATTIAQKEIELMDSVPEDGICLYVGIPFCPSICLYCSFSSYAIGAYRDSVEAYLDALKREIRECAPALKNRTITAIYFGGGTPTSLSADQLDGLLDTLAQSYDLSHLREYTVEAGRPDSITEDKLITLQKHGVDRISINPQTLQQATLDTIGRRHTVEDFYRAYELAQNYPFSINTDLIVGLPGEGEAEVADTLTRIKALKPQNLTVHSLAKKRASRLTEEWDDYAGDAFIYTGGIETKVYDTARELGMEPYYMYRQKQIAGNMENVGFALPGGECLYNVLMMEESCDIASFGVGAVSKKLPPAQDQMGRSRNYGQIKSDRLKNPKDVKNYIDRIDAIVQKKHNLFI